MVDVTIAKDEATGILEITTGNKIIGYCKHLDDAKEIIVDYIVENRLWLHNLTII